MAALPNPFDTESSMATGGSRKRRRRLGRTQRLPGLPIVSPPIPFDPASADDRFVLDDLAFMVEITPRPFFMINRAGVPA